MISFRYNDHLDALLRQEKQLIDIGAYKDNILTKDVGKWKAMKEVKLKKVLLQDQLSCTHSTNKVIEKRFKDKIIIWKFLRLC